MGLKLEVGKYYKTRDGRKVGPLVRADVDSEWPFAESDGVKTFRPDGSWQSVPGMASQHDLIAEWTDTPTGPVRTVTRTTREIVPGVYGRIGLDGVSGDWVRLYFSGDSMLDAAELRAAIATLTEIADALEEQ